ncbi:MAG: peptidyl-prolyl cis-trans isomerase [candidate division WOR-3 bacterium]|nr:peptidyl-prolyl cis-trans isomerase [candidate division WOR-3 bacterium]
MAIEKFRRLSKSIFIIVAIVFVLGFLLGELWQILRREKATAQNFLEKGILAKVGNKNITIQEYQNVLNYFREKYKFEKKLKDLSPQDEDRIKQEAWQYLTNAKIWEDILKKSKIKITEQEIIEIIRANPPQEIRDNPEFKTAEGNFDYEKYQNYIFAPENRAQLTFYAQELIDGLPREKFRLDVINAYRVTTNEIADAKIKDNTYIKTSYLYIGPKIFGNNRITIDEKELKKYYNENRNKYKREKRYRLRYIHFPLRITARDSNEYRREIEEIYKYARSEDFSSLIKEFSDFPTDTQARWIKLKDLDSITKSSILTLKDDSLTVPFLVGNTFQIIKVDKKTKDSVLIRKIVRTIQVTQESEGLLLDSIREFLSKAKSGDLDSVCKEYGYLIRDLAPWTKDRINFPALYNQYRLKEFALHSKSKAISEPLKARGGYYIFQLAEIEPAGIEPFDKVKSNIEWVIRREKEKELMKNYAQQIMEKIKSGMPLEEISKNDTLVELHVEEFNNFRECRNRKGSEFAGALYALEPGELYGVLATDIGSFIIRCDQKETRGEFDELIFKENRKTEIGNRIFQAVTKQPEIIDYRDERFF